ncbi:MAG TPA: O-antigen ligase family protein [Pseudolabrys sp.]|nr:O-antigen ligase family protein [Pseudolabrys sp.]
MNQPYRNRKLTGAAEAIARIPRLEQFIVGLLAATPLLAAVHFRWIDFVIPVAFVTLLSMAATSARYQRAIQRQWMLDWRNPLTLFAVASAGWMALSVLWAPNVHRAAFAALQAAAIVCGALSVAVAVKAVPRERVFSLLVKFVFAAILIATLASIGVIIIQRAGLQAPLAGDIRGAAPKLILFVWPALGWLAEKRRSRDFWLLLGLSVLLIVVSRSGAAGLALIGAAAVIAIGQLLPRLAVVGPLLLLLLAFIAAPFLNQLGFVLHWPHVSNYLARFEADQRIDIWTFYGSLFWQHPWSGLGFRAERFFDASLFPPSIPAEAHLHPHNEPLQVLLEFGIVGAALLLAALAFAARALWRAGRPQAVYVAACVAAFLLEGLVNFSLWESWWLAVVAIAFVFCGRLLDKPEFTAPARASPSPSASAATP